MIDFTVTGQVALVTGASRGIRQAVARALAAAGAKVACTARSSGRLAETLALIEEAGDTAIGVEWDVTDPLRATTAVAEIEDRLGPLTLAVNNAGIAAGTAALDLTPSSGRACTTPTRAACSTAARPRDGRCAATAAGRS